MERPREGMRLAQGCIVTQAATPGAESRCPFITFFPKSPNSPSLMSIDALCTASQRTHWHIHPAPPSLPNQWVHGHMGAQTPYGFHLLQIAHHWLGSFLWINQNPGKLTRVLLWRQTVVCVCVCCWDCGGNWSTQVILLTCQPQLGRVSGLGIIISCWQMKSLRFSGVICLSLPFVGLGFFPWS